MAFPRELYPIVKEAPFILCRIDKILFISPSLFDFMSAFKSSSNEDLNICIYLSFLLNSLLGSTSILFGLSGLFFWLSTQFEMVSKCSRSFHFDNISPLHLPQCVPSFLK